MRELREFAAGDAAAFVKPLRAALRGEGPALLPRPVAPPQDAAAPSQDAAADARASITAAAHNCAPRDTATDTAAALSTMPRAALPTRVPAEIALVIETSGSTARPKRVMLSTAALRAAADATHAHLGGPGQWLLCLPAHYIAGAMVIVRSLVAETAPVILPAGPFTPASFARAAARLTAARRYVSLVPVQLRRLVDAAAQDAGLAAALTRFDAILVGGQATPPELRAAAARLGWNLLSTYGSSETAGGIAYNARPLPGVRLREVAGELWVAGPMLAEGYLDDEARTAAAFIEDAGARWYRTGDVGAVAADGTISVRGRRDRVLISGGVKVHLDEVARAAAGEFTEVVAVAVPSREWGERVALIAADAASTVPAAATAAAAVGTHGILIDRLDDVRWQGTLARVAALGPAARPVLLARMPELPRLASGKVDLVRVARIAADASQG